MVKITRFTLPERRNPRFKSSKEFEMLKSLGEGGFSVVFEGLHKRTNIKYAVKIIDFDRLGTLDQENIQKEIEAHKNFNHPNIIKLHDYFQEGKKVYLILEICSGGNLFNHLSKINKLQGIIIQKIIKQTLLALKHIHDQGYVMRDIKPENILIDEQNNIKLCDFGWTASLNEDDNYRKVKAGTFAYMSPESLKGELQNVQSDIWSIGILLYELFHLKEPYSGISCDNQLKLITNNPVKFDYNKITKKGIDLIRMILKFKEFKRPSIQVILNSPFLQEKLIFDPNFKNEKIKEDFLKDLLKGEIPFDKVKMEEKKQKGINEIMGKYNVKIKRNNSVNVINKKPTNNLQIKLENREHKKRDYSQVGKKIYGLNNYINYHSTKNILQKPNKYSTKNNYNNYHHSHSTKNILKKTNKYNTKNNYNNHNNHHHSYSTKNILEKTNIYDAKNNNSTFRKNLYNKKFDDRKNDNPYSNLYTNKNQFISTKAIISNIHLGNKDFKQVRDEKKNVKFENFQLKKEKSSKKESDEKKKNNEIKKYKIENSNKIYKKHKTNEIKNSNKIYKKHKTNEIKIEKLRPVEYKKNAYENNFYKKKNFRNSKSLPMKGTKSNLVYTISKKEKNYKVNIYPNANLKRIINTEPSKKMNKIDSGNSSKKIIRRFSLKKKDFSIYKNNINFNDKNPSSGNEKNYNTKIIRYDLNEKKKNEKKNFNVYEIGNLKSKNPPVKVRARASKKKTKQKIHVDFYKNHGGFLNK